MDSVSTGHVLLLGPSRISSRKARPGGMYGLGSEGMRGGESGWVGGKELSTPACRYDSCPGRAPTTPSPHHAPPRLRAGTRSCTEEPLPPHPIPYPTPPARRHQQLHGTAPYPRVPSHTPPRLRAGTSSCMEQPPSNPYHTPHLRAGTSSCPGRGSRCPTGSARCAACRPPRAAAALPGTRAAASQCAAAAGAPRWGRRTEVWGT
eukprot:350044-Chlamydomonas_euryale.AAC.6